MQIATRKIWGGVMEIFHTLVGVMIIGSVLQGTVPHGMGNVVQPLFGKPTGSEVGTQGPSPQIGFPMGNQACIVPALMLAFAKTPPP